MHQIFREEPGSFARLLPRAGIDLPEYSSIESLDTDLTEIRPLERRVDSFFRVHAADDEGGYLLAVESQGKPDPDKHNSWAYYLASDLRSAFSRQRHAHRGDASQRAC